MMDKDVRLIDIYWVEDMSPDPLHQLTQLAFVNSEGQGILIGTTAGKYDGLTFEHLQEAFKAAELKDADPTLQNDRFRMRGGG